MAYQIDVKISWKLFSCIGLTLLSVLFLMPMDAAAAHSMPATIYESDDSLYQRSTANSVDTFCYGGQSIGRFSLSGSTNKTTTINGFTAYGVTDSLTVGYIYDGSYKTKEKESWNLISDSGKTVSGISLSKKIEYGVFIIQKSTDSVNWENAAEPICNLFSAKKVNWDTLYTVSNEELRAGTYFRVIIAYAFYLPKRSLPDVNFSDFIIP